MNTNLKFILSVPILLIGMLLDFPYVNAIIFVGGFLYGSALFDSVGISKNKRKIYNQKDLEEAFDSGKAYANNELELTEEAPSEVFDTSFNRWFFNNFLHRRK